MGGKFIFLWSVCIRPSGEERRLKTCPKWPGWRSTNPMSIVGNTSVWFHFFLENISSFLLLRQSRGRRYRAGTRRGGGGASQGQGGPVQRASLPQSECCQPAQEGVSPDQEQSPGVTRRPRGPLLIEGRGSICPIANLKNKTKNPEQEGTNSQIGASSGKNSLSPVFS